MTSIQLIPESGSFPGYTHMRLYAYSDTKTEAELRAVAVAIDVPEDAIEAQDEVDFLTRKKYVILQARWVVLPDGSIRRRSGKPDEYNLRMERSVMEAMMKGPNE